MEAVVGCLVSLRYSTSWAVASSPNSLPVIPLFVVSTGALGVVALNRFGILNLLRLFDPLLLLILLSLGGVSDLWDERVLVIFCASTSDRSVMSSIRKFGSALVLVRSGGRVHIGVATVFHSVCGVSRVLLPGKTGASNVRGGSLMLDGHQVNASREGNMLIGHEIVQSPEVGSASLENSSPLEFYSCPRPGDSLRLLMSFSFLS